MDKMKIRKAVFPVAGLGTRFLPATKANPKEMLPIVDKPLIQYAVEEAVAAGITQLIFVTSLSKRAIEDHFDSNYELEAKLVENGKNELVTLVREILPRGVSCVYVRQQEPLGLGHAVLCAKDVVGAEPFAILLADDLIDSESSCLQQMLQVYENVGESVIAVQKVAATETEKYGIVGLEHADLMLGEFAKITTIVEKPKANVAPSCFASIGRYILMPQVFNLLATTSKGAIGEIQLTDGIDKLIAYQKVYGYAFQGTRYDCGSKLGYLQATINYGLKHPEVGKNFAKYLQDFSTKSGIV